MINSTIGKYKITKLIGEGGMASVYQAEHEMLGTKVAIKVLNPILSANAHIKERFRNEAKLMASLNHPNITKVIDFDEQPQQLSIIMEFLEGEDLNQKIKRNGPLSEKEITDVFSQTLSAFQYAHEKGIVHRDIKPSNIFILPNGYVKILDFGIAKLFGQGNEMTQTGTQMGTPIYMSPEQVKGDKSIDHRSDIYSMGVTLFFAINGKPPYNSDTDSQFDIFNKIVYEPLPDLLKTSSLSIVISKACNKDRSQRFQYCQEWIDALINIESTQKNTTDNITVQIARVIESPYQKSLFPDFSPKENLSKTFYQAPYEQETKIKPKFPKNISKTHWLIYCLIVVSLTSGICLYQILNNKEFAGVAGVLNSRDLYFEGRRLAATGRNAEALKIYQELITNDTNYLTGYYLIATTWAGLDANDSTGNVTAAFERWMGKLDSTQRVKFVNDRENAYRNMAFFAQKRKDYEKASYYYGKVIEIRPEDEATIAVKKRIDDYMLKVKAKANKPKPAATPAAR
jgi:serine/threonine protein kinase